MRIQTWRSSEGIDGFVLAFRQPPPQNDWSVLMARNVQSHICAGREFLADITLASTTPIWPSAQTVFVLVAGSGTDLKIFARLRRGHGDDKKWALEKTT